MHSFQFPTGWNSTVTQNNSLSSERSFNSQRDGILPTSIKYGKNTAMFQFPTGWNSTSDTPVDTGRLKKFQFPTGWNSTKALIKAKKDYEKRFNSQRDGILRHKAR